MTASALARGKEVDMSKLRASTMKEAIVVTEPEAMEIVCSVGDEDDMIRELFYQFFGYTEATAEAAQISRKEVLDINIFWLRMKARRMVVLKKHNDTVPVTSLKAIGVLDSVPEDRELNLFL